MKKSFFIGIMLVFASSFSAIAQEVTIDMRYNLLRPEPAMNYLDWSIGSQNIKDSLDATTGASRARSTRELDALQYDSSAARRYTIPVGLRQLLLFPICPERYTNLFHLTVLEEGQRLVIRFILDGTVYQVRTNDRKEIDLKDSFSKAPEIAVDNSLSPAVLRPQYILPGGRAADWDSLDWSKVQWRPDNADVSASRKYGGILNAGYADGVLTVKGRLTLE
ncbi:MAG: hypothetical protein LBL73_04455 [Synergistaceae bacterium]|jgi:hypothetical protein|nr:hypothetical protein [Synergistaceae bacterium]